jgi:nitrogen fixation protein FixH
MNAPPTKLLRRSRWIPWTFVGGFLIVVAANATMIAFAIGSFTGLTTSEPHTKGLRFNDQIRQAEAQARLGWTVAARFARDAAQSAEIELRLTERGGAPLAGAAVTAVFARPVERDRDFTVVLQSAGNGRYRGRAAFPLPGAWDVKYRIERGGQSLEARERVRVD